VVVLTATALSVASPNLAAHNAVPPSPKRTFSHRNHSGSKGTLNPSGPGGFVPEIRGFCKFFLPIDSG